MTPPIPATIIGGPIELRDYDHLMRHCEGAAIRQMDGIATKGPAEEAPEA